MSPHTGTGRSRQDPKPKSRSPHPAALSPTEPSSLPNPPFPANRVWLPRPHPTAGLPPALHPGLGSTKPSPLRPGLSDSTDHEHSGPAARKPKPSPRRQQPHRSPARCRFYSAPPRPRNNGAARRHRRAVERPPAAGRPHPASSRKGLHRARRCSWLSGAAG